MDYEATLARLAAIGQEHLLDYYEELSPDGRTALLDDVERTDFSVLSSIGSEGDRTVGELTPADMLGLKEIEKRRGEFEKIGLKAIREGKIAAVLLAGGQGSRLGWDGPKGTFDIGVSRELPIFACQMENVKEVAKKAGYNFRVFIMTSSINDAATRDFFARHGYFGYDKDKISFFVQDMTPACDFSGKVLLSEKYAPALVPNGNGGWYVSLVKGGYKEILDKEGIEWLNVYGVDNVLQKICDPVFVGATLSAGVNCSGKVVAKACPEEKVGVLCKEDGAPTVIEYTELKDEQRYARDEEGNLLFGAGVILNYIFSVKKLDEIGGEKLPYHIARKKVSYIKEGKKVVPDEPNAYKFELLAVDLVKLMGNCLGFEVVREREFAPVKNATGVDSVDTARELLKANGVKL